MMIKGAPDYLLERTDKMYNSKGEVITLNKEDKLKIMQSITLLAEKGLRTLAIC